MKTRLFAAALAMAAMPVQAELALPPGLDLGEGRSVGHVRAAALMPEQARLWHGFRANAGYFGTMYVHSVEDIAFVTSGFHDLATAHAAGLKGCQEVARVKGARPGACTLYATVVPEGQDLNARQGRGLGQAARTDFLGRYTDCQSCEGPGGHGAFAIGGGSEYGMSWGWPDASEARGAALAQCRAAVADTLASLNNEGRRWVQARGLDRCRIIHLAGPQG
jgi:hypothetical protein